MKLRVDSSRCEGYGICKQHLPDAIVLDEWGFAQVEGEIREHGEAAARRAIQECPTNAIVALDE